MATDIRSGRRVAIKKMSVTPKNMKHLLTEVFIQKTSSHPNIVLYLGGYKVEDTLWVRGTLPAACPPAPSERARADDIVAL